MTTSWKNAIKAFQTAGITPGNYGWSKNDDGILMPVWFNGPELPDCLFKKKFDTSSASDSEIEHIEDSEDIEDSDDSDIDPWSDDSDSNSEEI